jgi:hypothetical protein
MKYLNKILIFSFAVFLGFAVLGFKLAEKKSSTIEKQQNKSKREILQSLVGSHSLRSISALMGANTLSDYSIVNGQWKANSSSLYMGQRYAEDLQLEPATIKTLNGLKITVGTDLSVSVSVNGMKYLNSPFNEYGVNYQLKKSPANYYQFPEGFSARTTFIDGALYIFAGDNIAESETAFADFIGVMREAALIRYNVESKNFELIIWGEGFGGTATLSFYK